MDLWNQPWNSKLVSCVSLPYLALERAGCHVKPPIHLEMERSRWCHLKLSFLTPMESSESSVSGCWIIFGKPGIASDGSWTVYFSTTTFFSCGFWNVKKSTKVHKHLEHWYKKWSEKETRRGLRPRCLGYFVKSFTPMQNVFKETLNWPVALCLHVLHGYKCLNKSQAVEDSAEW